ncbi:PDZ and LIM domain protein Zasp isoform X2 [Anabrus simplex]|uniref:PDZ and LIM domain protein Zasp isoform X2 n=1 Tax=Anabrus simplex TaxID=316456 RepID=UPI0035A3889E
MAQLINVKLSRFDSSPWGFRLQGGKDFGAPLLIQKVNGGSLAEKAGLQAGDAVIKVNDVEVFNLRHKEAQDAIVRAGNSFAVTVQRGGSTWKPQVTPVGPTPTINSSPTANIQPVTKTSLAAKKPAAKPIGTGHNVAAKPFGAPQVNGEPMVKSIVNKQYNTPVGMYSEESIAETLSAQAEVLAGGVLGVNFMKNEKNYNAANSEVFKMVQEIDSEPRDAEPEPPVGAAPVVSPPVSGLRHVSAPETRPTPTTPHEDPFKILPPGQNICADCERLIVGVFVRIKDKNLHVECFKCATCGTSLKNVGYYNINNKLYCDVHAKLVARQHPPAPNLEPITIPPGGKAPAGTISAALSSVTAPAPRPVPGPTSAPAPSLAPAPRPVPAPVSPSSPQTIGPMPFHPVGRPQISENGFVTENNLKNILTAIPALAIDDTDSGKVHPTAPSSIMSKKYKSPSSISAPKPFSVPTAPTTSPARTAPATSNKLVWPPQKEEEIPSSLLATAIPLYIPPTPSHQPKNTAIFAVPAQFSQIQFIGSQQNQTTPEHTQQQTASEKNLDKQDPVHLPSTQAKVQPLPSLSQPHSNAVSQVKETSLEAQQFSQQETETIPLTSSSQESSTLQVQQDLIQEQQLDSLVVSGKETESVVEIIQSEGEIRTASTNSEGEVKSSTINSEEEVKISSVTSEGKVKTTPVNSEEASLITQVEKTKTSLEQIAESQNTVVQASDSQEEQKPPSLSIPNDEILPQLTQETSTSENIQQTYEKMENKEVSAIEEVQIKSLSIVKQTKVDNAVSESSMMTEPPAADVPSILESEPQVLSSPQTETKPVQPEPQISETPSLSSETAPVHKQQASVPQPQSGNPGGSNINIQSQSAHTNKGLSYRQVPAGGFRPISSEFQTSVCQEVSQYTSVESFSKTTNTIQSSSNTGPVSFPAQTLAHNPKNESTASDNPPRSDACSSPMISALTIAPDRPYCLVPSAMKPQVPTHVQSFIPSSQSEAPTHVHSFIPSNKFAGTMSAILSTQVPPSTNMPGVGDETQLPILPPSSQHMSMVQALTIAPDRPYSPFLSSAQTSNTVVQSEASAFTAVSPQTVNTRPKMTVPQQSTVVSHTESGPQSYTVKPSPTSTVKRMASKPASPRPASRSSLPVMGAFRPTVPTGDLRPPTPDERWQLDSQQIETDTILSNTIQTKGMPNMTQVSLTDNTGGQVVVQRTRHVEESSTVSHREMKKTIQKSGHVSSVISSQELSNLSSTHSNLTEKSVGSHQQLKKSVFMQQEKQQQQYQQAKYSSFGTHKLSAIERFQIQQALSPAPHSPHIQAISPVSSPITTQKPIFSSSPSQMEKEDLPPQHPSQKQEVQTGSQPKLSTVPMVSQYRRQQYQQLQHEQKQLYSLSDVQKPAVIPFYQQNIAGYQKQRTISPAPHSQQVHKAISPASQQKSTNIHFPPTAPMQQPVSQTPSKPATLPQQKHPVPSPAVPSTVQTFPQQQPLPATPTVQNIPQQKITQTPAVPGSEQTLPQQQPLPPTPTIQNLPQQKIFTQTPAVPTQIPFTSEFSLPFPNIPLPEGMSVETLMKKNTQLSTKSSVLSSQPQPSQVAPPPPQASKSLPTAQPSTVTQSSTSAFKPQSPKQLPTEPQQTTPSLATQPSSVTKIPIPPTSSSIPNAGGGIGGGAGGGPTGQKGSASFAGSSAPRRGRGVLNQQAPGARIPLCGHCNNQIRGPFITALGRIWCPEHFICVNAQCRRPLQDIGFVEEKGDLYCEFCFEQYIAPTCSKCSKKVKGDCLNAIGKQFHPECFLCAYCGKLFGNNPFYLEDGLPYCETDWNELFTTKCFACGFPIEAGDRWVEALNNNYHSQCFNCTSCKKNLEGQNFYAKGGRPFCKAHAR